ncbi:MAG: hypothetical protein AVDCRST_MAG01-01-3395, partial [uncultured Rubrobacteraceae bacterium]
GQDADQEQQNLRRPGPLVPAAVRAPASQDDPAWPEEPGAGPLWGPGGPRSPARGLQAPER